MRRIKVLLVSLLLCMGCATPTAENPVESVTPSASGEPVTISGDYESMIQHAGTFESVTAGVKLTYEMEYEDGTKSVYDLDGVLEEDKDMIHLTQHINADGIQSDTEGWYDGSRLYMNYNNVTYYEDMSGDAVRQVMLVPVKPYTVTESVVERQEINSGDSETEYIFHLKPAQGQSVFSSRYDIYGLDQYDTFALDSGTITQAFDESGRITREETEFHGSLKTQSVGVNVTVVSSVHYMKINETDVSISKEQSDAFATYVNYKDIDTSLISDADVTSDYAEDNPLDTLKKRLVHRLNYAVKEDGTYVTEFNGTESYSFDFNNSIFTYSNRTSHYIYNWKGDIGGFGDTCTISFRNGQTTEGCDDSVVETMKDVKNYFLMELYYCGLSLDDIGSADSE